MTTNRVELIEPEDVIQQVLEQSAQAYFCHVIMIESYPPQVHPPQMAQISSTTTEPVTIPEVYNDFEDGFSTENAGHLPVHEDHAHAINLMDDK